ncbi:uncharacterized protein LOC110823798 isoform X2 [Carica papaya]|uniref:uncharacterized protein LOC110823798 isoform X2 n=1 Tax=Carica papaya TaxID=3649 RepID=UPI000B8C7EB6|nr:uncharacterized protein LOC110823798 isoform X2 [Carica papaya]
MENPTTDSASISLGNSTEENRSGSDTESNLDDDVPQYYQPISAVDGDEENPDHQVNSDEEHYGFQVSDRRGLSNGYCAHGEAEDGISSLRLQEDVEQKSDSEDEDDERMRHASDWAILRAFRTHETRRNAPLTAENVARIMETMRGVSFGGLAPDWATQVPEDRWIDQLRRLRPPSATPSSTLQN